MILERISIFLLFILPVVLTCPNRGCLCPSTGSNLIVPELLYPQQNKLERLVVYLYNVDGVLKLYTPHQNKQKLIPDLELSEEDHLQTVTIETIREIFSVSLNTITVYTKERRRQEIWRPIDKIGPLLPPPSNHYENPVIVLPNINNIIDRYPIQPAPIQEIIQNVYPKPNSNIQYNDLYDNIEIEYDIDPESYLYEQPVEIPNYINTYDLDPSTIIISDPYDINTNPIIRETINVPQDVNHWTPITQPIIESIYLQPNYEPSGPSLIEIDPNVEIRPPNDPSPIFNINELLNPANLNNEGKIKVITQPYQVLLPEVKTESNPYQIIYDPGSNEILYNLNPSIVESNELILPHTDINNYLPLTKWLITEMNVLKNNLNVAYDLIAIGQHVKDILVNNGLQINDNGILTDVKGNVLNVHYLNLRPIIIGPSKSYEGEIDVNHPLYTTMNYLQALLVTRTSPPGLLGVIPLSDSINPNKSLKPGVGELMNNLKKIPLLNHDTIYHSHPGKLELGDALKPQLDILNIDSNVDSDSNAKPIESNVPHQNSPINLSAYNKNNLGLLPAEVIEHLWNEPMASTPTSNIDLSHHAKPNYNEGNLLNYHNSQPYIHISDPQRLSSNNLLLELLHEQQNTNPIINPLNLSESKLNYPWYNIPGSLNIPSQQVLSNPLHLINGGYDISNLGQLNQNPQNYIISRPGKNTHITNQDDVKQYIDTISAENQMKHRQISYPNYNALQNQINQIDYGYPSSSYGILDPDQLHHNQDSIAISGQNLPKNIYGDNQRYLDLNSAESQILLQPHINNQYTNLRPYQISPNYDLDVINPFLPDGYSQHQEPSSLQNDLNSIYLNLENENNYQPNVFELDEDGSGQYTPLNLLSPKQNSYILNSVQQHPQLDVNNLDSNIMDVLNHQQNNNLINILQNQEALNLNAIQQSNDVNNINLNKVDQNIYNNILDLSKNQPSGDLNTIQGLYNNLNPQELQLVQPTTFSLGSNGHDLKIEGRPKYLNQNVKNDIVVDGNKLNVSSSTNLEILGRSADSLAQSNNQNGELINTINDQNLEQSVYENVDDNESLVDPVSLEHGDEIIGITKDTRTKAPDLISQENAYLSPLAEEEVLQLPSKNIITRQPRDFSDILMQGEGGDDGVVYRIIGGNAATGSGTPVSNKGRSGYYG